MVRRWKLGLCSLPAFCYAREMGGLLVHWLISSASLLIVAYLFPGIEVRGLGTALIAPIVIGFLNATIGFMKNYNAASQRSHFGNFLVRY